jgi:hypothetical protein
MSTSVYLRDSVHEKIVAYNSYEYCAVALTPDAHALDKDM